MNAQVLQPSASDYSARAARRWPAARSFAWLAAAGGILIVAALVRLYALELRPLHHDESVNAFFMMRLLKEGGYQYDPANYHGPTLYYLTLVAARALGLTIFAMRMVPALCGVATVGLALCLRRYVGTFGTLATATLIALSPGAVYISRYFIHESLFVFFTFGVVVAGFRYWETGRWAYLMCASVAAALVFATKETAIISAGVLVMAIFLAPLFSDIRKALRARYHTSESTPQAELAEPGRDADTQVSHRSRPDIIRALLKWVAAGALFVLVVAFFYSSLFTNRQWLGDVLNSYQYWARTGRSEHVHHWYTYLSWLIQEEGLLLVLGLIGVGLILWRSDNRFLIFVAIWSCGLLGAYSIVPYKTPWLMLNFIVPLACAGGYALNALRERAATKKQRVLVGVLAIILAATSYQMMRLNFVEYDDDRHPYVYAHTRRELLSLVDEVSRIASRAGTGSETTILITSSEYWPLPWYLRDYRQLAYTTEVSDLNTDIVIGSQDQENELQTRLGGHYERVASYVLRPGINLLLYSRRDSAGTASAM